MGETVKQYKARNNAAFVNIVSPQVSMTNTTVDLREQFAVFYQDYCMIEANICILGPHELQLLTHLHLKLTDDEIVPKLVQALKEVMVRARCGAVLLLDSPTSRALHNPGRND